MRSRTISGRQVRWDEARAQAAYAVGHWRRETLGDSLRLAATETPGRILLSDGEHHVDCATLYREACGLAEAMRGRMAEGSVVSFMLPNWHEAASIYLAISLAGMVAHPILPWLRERELGFMLEDADARMIFIPATLRGLDYREMLGRVAAQLARPPDVVVVRGESAGALSYTALLATEPGELPVPEADAVSLMLHTSGTTGTPKAVLHSHNSIHAVVRQIGRAWHVQPGDAFLVASPVSHIGGSLYAFECPLLLGTRALLMERWDADLATQLAQRERCTHMAGATPFLSQLLAATQRAGTRLPDLKVFICGGASVPPTLIQQAQEHFTSAAVTRVYGSTEVPVITVGSPERADAAHAAATDGRPGIADVKLVDASGRAADEGEIWARGPQMLVGYLHPEGQEGLFDADGFFRTGDLGRWQDGDYLVISGRLKDIIIRNGENISPKEVEDLLSEHPAIAEVTVVGLPHPLTGERACAVIVTRAAPSPDVAALGEYLKQRGLATFKIPEQVAVWNQLPKNDAGKILKHRVRNELMEQATRTDLV